jgi:hypothetical protein
VADVPSGLSLTPPEGTKRERTAGSKLQARNCNYEGSGFTDVSKEHLALKARKQAAGRIEQNNARGHLQLNYLSFSQL